MHSGVVSLRSTQVVLPREEEQQTREAGEQPHPLDEDDHTLLLTGQGVRNRHCHLIHEKDVNNQVVVHVLPFEGDVMCNGSLLKRKSAHLLARGDVLQIGGSELQYGRASTNAPSSVATVVNTTQCCQIL